MDNNTLYSRRKRYTFQSHLHIDYLILTSEQLLLSPFDRWGKNGDRICHLPKVTKPTNSCACFLIFPLCWPLWWWRGFVCPLKSRVFSPTFFLAPCFGDAAVGEGECFFCGFSCLWDTVRDEYERKWKQLLLPSHTDEARVCL